MTEQQAMRMALAAMEKNQYAVADTAPHRDVMNYNKAITAIKEALAQPEQEPVTLSEGKKLILVDSSFDDLMYWLERCESKGHLENCSDLIEPWEKFCDSYCVWTDHHPDCKLAERKPLTDGELRKLADKHLFYQPEGYEVSGVFALARAIEVAHGIKD